MQCACLQRHDGVTPQVSVLSPSAVHDAEQQGGLQHGLQTGSDGERLLVAGAGLQKPSAPPAAPAEQGPESRPELAVQRHDDERVDEAAEEGYPQERAQDSPRDVAGGGALTHDVGHG